MKTAVVQAQQRWEHIAITRRSESALVDDLNQSGDQGWELVAVFHYKDAMGSAAWTAFLKRPKAGPAAKGASPGTSAAQTASSPKDTDEPAGFDLSGDVFGIQH